jgi:hypothetical protein
MASAFDIDFSICECVVAIDNCANGIITELNFCIESENGNIIVLE